MIPPLCAYYMRMIPPLCAYYMRMIPPICAYYMRMIPPICAYYMRMIPPLCADYMLFYRDRFVRLYAIDTVIDLFRLYARDINDMQHLYK